MKPIAQNRDGTPVAAHIDNLARQECRPLTTVAGQIGEACRLIRALVDVFDNDDALDERYALAAVEANRPAYWTTATYHNQRARAFVEHANVHGLQHALDLAQEFRSPPPCATPRALLASLVPLNKPARDELTARANAD